MVTEPNKLLTSKIEMVGKTARPRVILEEHGIPNISEFADRPLKGGWTLQGFKKNFKITVVRQPDERELEFDLIGCPAALANAFRRIMLNEVPSMAIDKVYMYNNTSVLPDEILSHRFGLVPLRADPRLFEYPTSTATDKEEVSDQDTLRYEIKVTCTWNPQAPKDSRRPDDIYRNNNVYAKDIKWVPIGRQSELYPRGEEQLGILEGDILLSQMRPGQEIHAFMHAVKGTGSDHSKFSPVATATYRLLPEIDILRPIRDEDADLLKTCFSPGVIEIVKTKDGSREARVKSARYDTCSRNVFRHEHLKDSVQLSKIADHFIFTVESVGALPPNVIFTEAVKILKGKARAFLDELESMG